VSFASPKSRISSMDRLSKLPALFSLTDLCRLHGMSIESAKLWVNRMARLDKVKFVGPRTGYYFNSLIFPNAHINNLLDAVQAIYPSAIVIGANVLHAYGWITQIPQIYDVAIISQKSLAAIYGVELHMRPRSWYIEQQKNNAVLRQGESHFSIDSLTPLAALEDARAHKHTSIWVPDPDDLYIPDDPEEDVIRLTAPSKRSRLKHKA